MDKDFKDYIDIGPDDILNDLKRQQEAVSPATDELRLKLNEVIAKYNINSTTTLAILSRLAAGYVHQMQQQSFSPSTKDIIEENFHKMFEINLSSLDIHDVNKEMERMKRMEEN